MRTFVAFVASLILALALASSLSDSGNAQHVLTGIVGEYVVGESILVGNATTDPRVVQFTLRETTAFDGDPAFIKAGTRVTVWYTIAAERRPFAARLRVLRDTAAQ